MGDTGWSLRPKLSPLSLVVIDDNAFIMKNGQILPRTGDFWRFALRLGRKAGRVTLCCPVLGMEKNGPGQRITISGGEAELVPTFPYTKLTEYIRKLPAALYHNVPALSRAIRAGDLVLIRLPAANGLLAFTMAVRYRKPVALFLVGYPAQGALAAADAKRPYRAAIRLAAWLEWTAIAWMARRAPVFVYGNALASRLESYQPQQVMVTFTSLVEEIPEISRDQDREQTRLTLLYAGRFAPEKSVGTLLDAAKLCADDGVPVRVVLVGDGPLAPGLREHPAIAAGLDVEFTGWLDDGPQLDKVFREADIYAQPSQAEGIPKVLLQAMAYGLPIVATNAGGIPDVVTDGEQGLVVPIGDPVAMAQALSRLAADPGLRRRFGQAGKDFAMAHTAARQADAIWQQIARSYPDLA